jgi:hypothetical protein
MAGLMVSAAGYVSGPRVGVGLTTVEVYISVASTADGTPVTGLSGANFSIKLFTADPIQVPITVQTAVQETDESGKLAVDENGNPQLNYLVRPTGQPGVYISGGATTGRVARTLWVRVQTGSDQGEAVGTATHEGL